MHFIQETDCENVYSVCSNEMINAASENFCSQLISNMQTVWTQSGPTKCWARSEFKLFDTDSVIVCILTNIADPDEMPPLHHYFFQHGHVAYQIVEQNTSIIFTLWSH